MGKAYAGGGVMEQTKQLATWTASVVSRTEFVDEITNLALYQNEARALKVVDAETMHQAIDLRAKTKKSYANVEKYRQDSVALPNAQAKFVNDMVRGVKGGFEKIQKSLGEDIQKQKTAEEAAAREALAKEVPVEVLGDNGGVEIVMTGEVKVVAPPNVVQTAGGVSVHTRGVPKCSVEDKMAMLKAVVSTAKGNAPWGLECVDINMVRVKAAAKEKAGDKREIKIPGGKYWTEDVLI
jgi:hypothetical protein